MRNEPADDGGSGDSGEDPLTNDTGDPQQGTLRMSVLDSNVESNLGNMGIYRITLNSVDGFEGPVALGTDDVPEGWDVSFESDGVVTLAAGESRQIDVQVEFSTTGTYGNQGFSVNASNETFDTQSVELSADVENVVELEIANNTGGQSHVFPSATIRLGTAIRFVNMDTSQPHRIHSNFGGVGFPHQDNNMQLAPSVGEAGGIYEFTVDQAGLYSGWYCHVHGRNVGEGQFDVIE